MPTTLPTMLIFTTSTLQQPKTNIPSLYCQGSTLPGIIYVGNQPWDMMCCIPMSSTNLSITYTMITKIEKQPLIIGVEICRSLQEVLQLDQY